MEEKKYTDKQLSAIHDLNKLKELLKQNNDNYIYLGLLLRESDNFYRNIPDKNYKDLYSFAKEELELCRTTVKYLIGVNRRFANGMKLQEKYEKYKYSQLREMLSLSDSQLDLVNPAMTVEEIKALKKVKNVDEDTVLNKLKSVANSSIAFETVRFNNNDEREKFLKDYLSWELFAEVPELTLKFYRAKLSDESYVVATRSEFNYSQTFSNFYNSDPTRIDVDVKYTLFDPNNKYSRYLLSGISKTSIIEHLRSKKLNYLKLVQHD